MSELRKVMATCHDTFETCLYIYIYIQATTMRKCGIFVMIQIETATFDHRNLQQVCKRLEWLDYCKFHDEPRLPARAKHQRPLWYWLRPVVAGACWSSRNETSLDWEGASPAIQRKCRHVGDKKRQGGPLSRRRVYRCMPSGGDKSLAQMICKIISTSQEFGKYQTITGKGVRAPVIQSLRPRQDLKLTSLRIISPLPAQSRGGAESPSKIFDGG